MTVQEYITSKLQSFGINLSKADLFDISTIVNLDEDMDKDKRNAVFYALVKFIPMLLLRAKSVSENGFSISYSSDDLLRLYAWLCSELGIEDTLNEKPKVTFL